MAISTNGTVLARLAGALYNTQMSNATYSEVKTLDPAALANTLYARDFASSTDLSVATTLVTNLGLTSVTGLANWVAAQLTAAGAGNKGAKIVDLLNGFAQLTTDTVYGAAAIAFNASVDAALVLSQTTGNAGGTFNAATSPSAITFALTVGADVWTGGSGNDTINATVATLGSLDVIDGGAGTDTLNIVDTAAVATLGGATFSNIETVKISSGGAVGAISAAAGTPASAVAQQATVVLSGTYATGDTLLVTVGGKVWTATVGDTTSSTTFGQDEAATAVRNILLATLSDSVTVASASTGTGTAAATFKTTIGLTAKVAGTPIGVSIAKGTVAGTASASLASAAASQSSTDGAILYTANVTATGATAVAEQKQLTLSGSTAYVGSITVTIDGTSYTAAPAVASANAASTSNGSLAADVARVINSVLGTGSATSSGTTTGAVVVTAKTAGTPVPNINVVFNADGSNTLVAPTEAWSDVVPNMALTAAATTAAAIAAPTGTIAYTVKAAGVANISGAATTALDVSGTAVKTSGGSTVKVAGSDSVQVSGAKGAVTVTTGKATTTLVGAVAADTSGGTAGDAAGVYVTGGTDVTLTVAGDNSGAIKIGAAAYAKAAVNTSGYPQSNGNASVTPTGNVTVSGIKTTTSTTDGKVDAAYNGGNVTIYMNGGTTATVKGGATVAITDVQTTGLTLASTDTAPTIGSSTLSTVTLAGLSGNATITSDAVTTVSVSDTLTARTVTVANSGKVGANSGAITFNVSNLGGSSANVTLKDDTATSVNVGSASATAYDKLGGTAVNAGSKSYIVLDTAKATNVTFSNDKSVALAASTLPVAATITATGSGALDLGTVGTLTTGAATIKTTSVDASAASGAVTVSLAATINGSDANNHGMSFKGGSGNDIVTLTGAMTSGTNASGAVVQNTIDLGAGNDTLLKNGGSIAAGSTVNGGDGNDTIAASLLTAGNSAQITGFEVLGLDLTSGSYDTDLLVGATGLALLAQGGTYTNVEQTQGLTIVTGASSTSTTTNTITFTSSTVTGSADAYTVSFAQSAPTSTVSSYTTSDAGVVVLAGIETINVASGGTGFLNNFITITGANARNVNLTGAQNLDIDFSSSFGGSTTATSTNGLGVATIDGSAMTGKLTINTASVLEAYLTTTIKGGSNNDTITLSALGGKAVVDAGAGDDKIVSAAASSIQSGGAGKDTFDVTLAPAKASGSATGYVTTITDFAAGDVLDFIGGTNGTHTATAASIAKLTLTTEATLDDAIVSALNASPKATLNAKEVVWFYYGGNTYVTFDAADDTTTNGGMANGDIVVKLTGVVDLTNATFDATNGSVTIPV
jgi:hypothetical protein